MKVINIIVALSIILSSAVLANEARFTVGTTGYLMDTCEDVISNPGTFNSGYCAGVYNTVHRSKLMRIGVMGVEYCPPKDINTFVNVGIIIKYIKANPKYWATGDDYYAVELALKEAWPCK